MSPDNHTTGNQPLGPGSDCMRVRANLVPYLDGEAAADEALLVARHVGRCPDCARALASHRQLGDWLRVGLSGEERDVDTGAGLRLAASIRRIEGQRRRLRILVVSATAALLLLSVGGLVYRSHEGGGKLEVAVSASAESPPAGMLESLEVLEAFDAEGTEPSTEIVEHLLGEGHVSPREPDAVDPASWEDLLEEELTAEKL